MKKFSLFFMMMLFVSTLLSQTVTLTFIGLDANGNTVKLNSVNIRNITQGWQETIYAPDTTMTMDDVTGIAEIETIGTFALLQNNPNPFNVTTEAMLTIKESGPVTMEISDVNGRIVETQNFASLQTGNYRFRIQVSDAGIYFMTARQRGQSSTIKMVNNGNGAVNSVEYVGGSGTKAIKETKATCSNPFALGDQMEYVAYATINGEEVESEHLTQVQNDYDPIVMTFAAAQVTLPVVLTDSVTNITDSSVICYGTVADDGGAAVTARGVCWGINPNPTTNDSTTTDGTGTGSFISNITGLTDSTTYYVRAYATNSVGVAYGNVNTFTTSSASADGQPCPNAATLTDVDGNVYNTVQIGNQCWMKENLRTTHYADGSSISLGSSTSTTTAYRYCPDNDTSNVTTYGYLYNWLAVMHNSSSSSSNPSGVQGICPTGWHVPSDAEWTQLTNYVSSQSEYVCGSTSNNIAKALASSTGWETSDNNCAVGYDLSSNNATGFSAVPASSYTGSYNNFGHIADFWSATQFDASRAYYRFLHYDDAYVYRSGGNKYNGCSVRCLKDGGSNLTIPNVTTIAASAITQTTATCVGNVTDDGGAMVTDRGICYNTTGTPTVSDSCVSAGIGMGVFTSNITDLTVNTTYYVRAYAINSVGVAYGNPIQFTTTDYQVPTVLTTAVTAVYNTSATCGGNVTDDGGAMVTDRGICYNTTGIPTISDSCVHSGTGTGAFSQNLTDLDTGTTYYVRAYAINNVGIAYGSVVTFTTSALYVQPCPGVATITDVDGNVYNTVQIGNQCWMKENLRTTHYADGSSISLGSSTNSTTAYRYCPNNDTCNVPTYGYLYNWPAVMHNSSSSSSNPSGVQGICPNGWHVPSDAEWTQLTNYVSSQSEYVCGSTSNNIAKALASTTGWNSYTSTCAVGNDPSTNNATGFSAVPAGEYSGHFHEYADFWSATKNNLMAYYIDFDYRYSYVYRYSGLKGDGFSVRCLKD